MLQMAVDTHTLAHWWWFELNSSNMGSSLHKSCCHWILFQFLAYLGILFFLSSFLMAPWQSPIHWEYLMRLWWTLDISTKGLDASKNVAVFPPSFCPPLVLFSHIFKDTMNTMLRYIFRILPIALHGNQLVGAQIQFYARQTMLSLAFSIDSLKCIGTHFFL